MATKKEQAVAIFKSNQSASRDELINMFVTQLDMTPAGAATYYASTRKIVQGGVPASRPTRTTTATPSKYSNKADNVSADARQLHHVAYLDDHGLVRSTSSHYDKAAAQAEHEQSPTNTVLSSGKLPKIEEE